MQFNKRQLKKEADKYQYVRDTYEKVIRLVAILSYIRSIPFLFQNLALKGGTAINLTVFDMPRLSVDIDLDFTNHVSREDMMIMRLKIRELFLDYIKKNGYHLDQQSRTHHSLESFKLNYLNAGNMNDSIKIEINYSLRAHIYEPIIVKSKNYGLIKDVEIRTLHPLEIFGSKLVALMTRSTPRDLFDFNNMMKYDIFEEEDIYKIKKCAVFYRAISNEDGRYDFTLERIHTITQNHIKRFLVPVIHSREFFSFIKVKEDVLTYFDTHFVLEESEKKFLTNFSNRIYTPELLFSGAELERIKCHPMAIWKTRVIFANE